MIPPQVRIRNEPPLRCYYCAMEGQLDPSGRPRGPVGGVRRASPTGSPASVTVHDERGCLHVCWDHAQWRVTTSSVSGHSPDCPYHR
jgi:hypothetical protein